MEQGAVGVPPRHPRRSGDPAPGRREDRRTATERSAPVVGSFTSASFDDFYTTERDSLARSLALIVGDPLVAAELIDEAMVRAYQRWDRVRALQRPSGWVYRVALNLSTSRFRRLRREVKYRWLSTPPSPRDDTIEAAFRSQIEDDRLLSALLELSIDQRTVVVARILLDYSEAEVAELVGVRPGTVKSRLSRGLEELRAALPDLAPEFGTTSPTKTNTSARRDSERSERAPSKGRHS